MSRRLSNGRSPLVRKQSQITRFFSNPNPNPSPGSSSTPPNPTPKSKLGGTPSSNPSPSPSPLPSPSPATSVSVSGKNKNKSKKPVLEIAPSKTPSPPIKPKTPLSGETKPQKSEFVGRRIRVYWPLDETWYTGQVKSYDAGSGKHVVQYDDGDDESIELEKEKIEWIEEEEPPKKLRRLRKMSDDKAETVKREKSESEECELDCVDDDCIDDDSSDEDWGKNAGKETSDGDSEEVELELEEEDEEVVAVRSRKAKSTGSQSAGKRKKVDVGKMGCIKKFKFDEDVVEKGTQKAEKGLAEKNKASLEIRSIDCRSEALSHVPCKGGSSIFC